MSAFLFGGLELRTLPKSVSLSEVEEDFEACWKGMVEHLKAPKTFSTTGGIKKFKVWSEGSRIYYEKSTGDVCPLSLSDFTKGFEIFKRTGSLSSATYHFTMHGSYIPPLLFEYFVKGK